MTLHHERITAGPVEPAHWLYVLHGIYGAGRNWASVIRRVVRARPEWGALLIDLREHGNSQGLPGPHTVQAAARDVADLIAATSIAPTAVLGHSFGGKVALVFAGEADATIRDVLRQVWVIDSTPDARAAQGSAWTMLEVVRSLPDRFGSRAEAVEGLVAQGLALPTAQWMATNLEADGPDYRWRIDFAAMEELLLSFFATDAWGIVEAPGDLAVHLVKAEESSVLSGATLERAQAASQANAGVMIHVVAGGHWVNAENPAAIEELLVQKLPQGAVRP